MNRVHRGQQCYEPVPGEPMLPGVVGILEAEVLGMVGFHQSPSFTVL